MSKENDLNAASQSQEYAIFQDVVRMMMESPKSVQIIHEEGLESEDFDHENAIDDVTENAAPNRSVKTSLNDFLTTAAMLVATHVMAPLMAESAAINRKESPAEQTTTTTIIDKISSTIGTISSAIFSSSQPSSSAPSSSSSFVPSPSPSLSSSALPTQIPTTHTIVFNATRSTIEVINATQLPVVEGQKDSGACGEYAWHCWVPFVALAAVVATAVACRNIRGNIIAPEQRYDMTHYDNAVGNPVANLGDRPGPHQLNLGERGSREGASNLAGGRSVDAFLRGDGVQSTL